MSTDCPKRKRILHPWEAGEFGLVFGASLKYDRVRIHEFTALPDRIDRLGRRLRGMEPPGENEHNAITVGDHCIFPVRLPESLPAAGDPDNYKLGWLIHELTHVWQYQHIGWRYLTKALIAQFRDKDQAYDYGGEAGLLKSRQEDKRFMQFNPEQQGNIVQDYFVRKRANLDVNAWQPYIDDLQSMI